MREPSGIASVARSTPPTAGIPYARATTAPWVMSPPTSVTRLDAELGRTFERMTSPLRDNGVDLGRNRPCVGPLLRTDSEREAFSGHPDADAWLTRGHRRPSVVP